MSCGFNTPGCYGPYEMNSCDRCRAGEGKCLRNAASTTCDGPLEVKRCGFCRSAKLAVTKDTYGAFATDRAKRDDWVTGLGLGGVAMEAIFPDTSPLTPAQIDQKYAALAKQNRAGACPWVKVGSVYMTVTTGNNTGWRDLITKHLQPAGLRSFSVFTGRHGVINGTLTSDTSEIFCDKVPDANHLREDIVQKAALEGHFKGLARARQPVVRLFDVGTTAGTTMTRTQQLAQARMNMGDTVIFAWCWSLLSAYKVTVSSDAARMREHDMALAYNKPIRDIVEEKYGWIGRYDLADVYSDDYITWRSRVAWREDESRDAQRKAQRAVPDVRSTEALYDEVVKHVHAH